MSWNWSASYLSPRDSSCIYRIVSQNFHLHSSNLCLAITFDQNENLKLHSMNWNARAIVKEILQAISLKLSNLEDEVRKYLLLPKRYLWMTLFIDWIWMRSSRLECFCKLLVISRQLIRIWKREKVSIEKYKQNCLSSWKEKNYCNSDEHSDQDWRHNEQHKKTLNI